MGVPALTVFLSIHYMLVTQWGFLDSLWRSVTGGDGPLFLVDRWLATATNLVSYIWKWMPFWTLIFIAGRMAIPQDIYEAAEIDGAIGWRRLVYVTFPLLGERLSGLRRCCPPSGRSVTSLRCISSPTARPRD